MLTVNGEKVRCRFPNRGHVVAVVMLLILAALFIANDLGVIRQHRAMPASVPAREP